MDLRESDRDGDSVDSESYGDVRCSICWKDRNPADMLDGFCNGCAAELFRRAVDSEDNFPAKLGPRNILDVNRWAGRIDPELFTAYKICGYEYQTLPINRVYCACEKFVGGIIRDAPSNLQAIATCSSTDCAKIYCMICSERLDATTALTAQHSGCSFDLQSKLSEKEAAFAGLERGTQYQFCPRCGRTEERFAGCNHINCPCGESYCYICGQRALHYSGHWDDEPGSCPLVTLGVHDEWEYEADLEGDAGLRHLRDAGIMVADDYQPIGPLFPPARSAFGDEDEFGRDWYAVYPGHEADEVDGRSSGGGLNVVHGGHAGPGLESESTAEDSLPSPWRVFSPHVDRDRPITPRRSSNGRVDARLRDSPEADTEQAREEDGLMPVPRRERSRRRSRSPARPGRIDEDEDRRARRERWDRDQGVGDGLDGRRGRFVAPFGAQRRDYSPLLRRQRYAYQPHHHHGGDRLQFYRGERVPRELALGPPASHGPPAPRDVDGPRALLERTAAHDLPPLLPHDPVWRNIFALQANDNQENLPPARPVRERRIAMPGGRFATGGMQPENVDDAPQQQAVFGVPRFQMPAGMYEAVATPQDQQRHVANASGAVDGQRRMALGELPAAQPQEAHRLRAMQDAAGVVPGAQSAVPAEGPGGMAPQRVQQLRGSNEDEDVEAEVRVFGEKSER